MKGRRLVFSDAAVADVLEQAEWYAVRSGRTLERRWEKAVQSAVSSAVRSPAAGAPCRFSAPELSNLRRTLIPGFPRHLLFYRFDDHEIFILRIVHGARDLERLFS